MRRMIREWCDDCGGYEESSPGCRRCGGVGYLRTYEVTEEELIAIRLEQGVPADGVVRPKSRKSRQHD